MYTFYERRFLPQSMTLRRLEAMLSQHETRKGCIDQRTGPGQSQVHSRDHGAGGIIYRGAGMGRNTDGSERFADRPRVEPPAFELSLVCGLAWRSRAGSLDRQLGDGTEGPGRRISGSRGTRPEICTRSVSGDDCWGGIDAGVLPLRSVSHDAGRLAASLRSRGRYGWCVFGKGCSDHGCVLYGDRNAGAVQSVPMGELVHGGWFWRIAHRFWNRHRKEVRWLGTAKQKHTQGPSLHAPVRRRAGPRTLIA